MYRKVRNIKNTVNISRIWKKCVTTLKGIPVIGLETQSFSATRAISRHEYETSANNPESPENRKWIRKLTEKKKSSSFFKGEDDGFSKLLIYGFCISQKQNSRVDQMHALWAFMRGSGDDQGLKSRHGKHLF